MGQRATCVEGMQFSPLSMQTNDEGPRTKDDECDAISSLVLRPWSLTSATILYACQTRGGAIDVRTTRSLYSTSLVHDANARFTYQELSVTHHIGRCAHH